MHGACTEALSGKSAALELTVMSESAPFRQRKQSMQEGPLLYDASAASR